MKELTEEDIVKALNRGINFAKESARKENRDLYDFEVDEIKSAEETLAKIKKTGYHFRRIVKLSQKKYTEESIILTVTIFEILMRNIVKDFKKEWFYLPQSQFSNLASDEKLVIRKKIKKYLDELKLYDTYIKNIHLYQDIPNTEIEALYFTLFDDETNFTKINFQNLNDKNGVKKLLTLLFDIDISRYLDSDAETAQKKWKLLDQLIKERHKIIHLGESTTLEPKQVIEVLNIIDLLNHNIQQKLLCFAFSELKQNFVKATKELEKKGLIHKNNIPDFFGGSVEKR
jgi:hypothetical protein